MGNQCCSCCCINSNESGQSSDFSEKEIEQQQTIDYRVQKGPTNINVLHKTLNQSNCLVIISSCDERGKSPQNKLLEKNAKLAEQVSKSNNQIGKITEIQNEKIYLFLVLPLYLGEDLQITQLKLLLHELAQLIIDRGFEEIAIEDVGVKRFGYPRQIVARQVIETFAKHLHKMTSLSLIEFMVMDVKSKILFESEIQARRQQLVSQDSVLKIDKNDEKSLRKPLIA